MKRLWLAVGVWLCTACAFPLGGLAPEPEPEPSPSPTAAPDPCPRDPAPANRTRHVVISHPYDSNANPVGTFAVYALAEDGELTATVHTFEMGRTLYGEVVFTPDGELGFVAQQDGTLGAFRLAIDGTPKVEYTALTGSFYATALTMSPDGKTLYVLDGNWRENGGGIYAVGIDCDGVLDDRGLLAVAKLPQALAFTADERALLAAKDFSSTPEGADAHLVSWKSDPEPIGVAEAFPDNEAIVSAAALTPSDSHFLIADNSAFSGIPNRIAVVEVGADALTPLQVLPVEDPVALLVSPFEDAAVAVSGFGDAVFVLAFDPLDPFQPFTIQGELAYTGGKPQLPGTAAAIRRGDLNGMVLVSENQGVRRVRFEGNGTVTDLGLTSSGTGYEAIVGALGVQP